MMGETDLILTWDWRVGESKRRNYLGKAFSKEIILVPSYEG